MADALLGWKLNINCFYKKNRKAALKKLLSYFDF